LDVAQEVKKHSPAERLISIVMRIWFSWQR